MHPPSTDPARVRQVEMILEQVESLPTLSPVAARLLRVACGDDADLGDISRLIESDPPLSARILGMCRRSDRGLGDRITTVKRAVSMLGLDAVRACVLSVSIYDTMSTASRPGNHLDEPVAHDPAAPAAVFERIGFWKHSLAVACACECLAEELSGSRVAPEEAFLAGLVHDLGKLALELILPRSYARVLALAERRQSDSAQIERAVLGLDHHAAGKRIAEHWRLPESLQEVMWFHSQPSQSLPDTPNRQLIALVTLAKSICRNLHLGWSGDFGPITDPSPLCTGVGLEPGVAMSLAEPLARSFAARCEMLGLDQTPGAAVLLDAVMSANRQLARLTSSLQTRSKLAQTQAKVLDAVHAFHGGAIAGRGVVETLNSVADSAAHLLGPGFYALLFQHGPSSAVGSSEVSTAWQFYQFAPATPLGSSGRVVRSRSIDPPPSRELGGRSLAALCDPTQVSMAAVGILPWLSDELIDAPDMRRVKLMSLTVGPGQGRGRNASPGACLLHDRDLSEFTPIETVLSPLVATWTAAIHAAAEHEDARRLSQRLAEVGRSLAEAQSRLTETESLARLGEMTAGAAHEMNNPLAIISGRSQLLVSHLDASAERDSAIAIARAAQDLSDLITSLNLIADPPAVRPEPMELAALAKGSLTLAAARLRRPARVDVHIAPELTVARLDRELIAPALAELIVNAAEAAPDQIVTLRIQADPLDDRLILRVEDRGPGLSARVRQHAFDPFFSEKPAGRQRGLGLTRARRLVQAHGGQIELVPVAGGRGAIASIEIPAWRCQPAIVGPQSNAPRSAAA